MICRIEDLKKISQILLTAVDAGDTLRPVENLELKVDNSVLTMSVTNGEYLAKSRIPIFEDIDFHATVKAQLFLSLISKITTDTVQFDVVDNYLKLTGNGEYKLPLIYDGDVLLELPEIDIENVTSSFDISGDTLSNIYQYNSKELLKGTISKPVQKMYYVDDKGAITFTSGACVYDFTLDKPVKLLFNQKLVKLFKLFKGNDTVVHFTLGQDPAGEYIQTKVKFETGSFTLTSIINNDDSMLNSVPVTAIRGMANDIYANSATLHRTTLLQAINRLLLFSKNELKSYCTFTFEANKVTISDLESSNSETIHIENVLNLTTPYVTTLDLIDLKLSLESWSVEYVNLNFGNHRAVTLVKPDVRIVIPEATI